MQAAHAVLRYAAKYPGAWHWGGVLVILAVPDLATLERLHWRLANYRHAPFYEPDLDDALTAIAAEASASRVVSHLPLALRGEVSDMAEQCNCPDSSWLQAKVAAQAQALDVLNRRVLNQRLQLRELNRLGRGLTRDEYLEARERLTSDQVRERTGPEPVTV